MCFKQAKYEGGIVPHNGVIKRQRIVRRPQNDLINGINGSRPAFKVAADNL